jgi:hypothetical protein
MLFFFNMKILKDLFYISIGSLDRFKSSRLINNLFFVRFLYKDIIRFMIIFLIIFAAFIISLNNLFWYYQSNVRSYVEIMPHYNDDNSTTNAEKSFGT